MENPLTEELKLKKHSVEVSYNAPATAGTKINFTVFPGGDQCLKIHQDLQSKYKDTIDKDSFNKMLKEFGENQTADDMEWGYFELRLKMNGDSSELAKKLQDHKDGLNSLDERLKITIPKIASNGDYLEIGVCYPCPKEILKSINYEKLSPIVDQIKGVDQRINLNVELGTSCKDVLEGGESLIAEANKGFKVQFNLDVLENFKKICYDVIKNPEATGPLTKIAAAIAPFVLL